MAPGSTARLQAHVAAILQAAAVPADARDDLAEELYGHLVERVQVHRDAGIDEAAAVDLAMHELGGAEQLGRDFQRTYHSRLWASTVGILLPAVAPRDDRPPSVAWLRIALGVVVVLTAIGLLVMLPQATPVRALGTLIADGLGLWAIVLAFLALARGQRWALWYALAITAELLLWGIGSVLATAPGSVTIPLGAILAGLVLFEAFADRFRLQAFVAGSRPIGPAMTAALAFSLLVPAAVPPALAALPDPTQAGSSDLLLTASMRCDHGDIAFDSGTVANRARVTLVADMTWRRSDLLPDGLAGLFHSTDSGDTAGFRLLDGASDSPPLAWMLIPRDTPVVDVATGQTAGWFGSTAPSVALLPDTIGSFTVGIDLSAIRPGHTLRATWLLTPVAPDGAPWPSIEVAYAHLDHFLLEGTLSCAQTVTAHEVPVRAAATPPTFAAPFGIGYP